MKKKKKIMITCASLVAAAVLVIGGTLAFMHKTTETAVNTFKSEKNISLQLREPAWDGYEFGEDGYNNGETPKDPANADLGFNKAKDYTPGDDIPKDPTVKNDGTKGEAIYTALKVQYFKVTDENGTATETQMSYADFKSEYLKSDLDFASDWEMISADASKDQIYLYGKADQAKALAIGDKTTPLFTTVPLSLDLEPVNGAMPQFKIKVQAFAIQTSNIEENAAKDMMLNFIGTIQ